MSNLKEHQPPLSIDEQILNLREKGLIINDEDYAKSFLNDVSYFRLIKAYSLGLKVKNCNYHENVRFEDIVNLYLFNAGLRQILFPQIEKIEVNLRCRLSNYFCDVYGIFGYENKNNFSVSESVYENFIKDVKREINRNARASFVKNFRNHYIDGKIPFYALVELLSFGTLSKLYKNMKNTDKKVVAELYGVGYTYFESWIESVAYIRNICAHYGRLYNNKLAKMPKLYKQYNVNNNRIFAILIIIKYLVPNDRHWFEFVQSIEYLIEKYPIVDLEKMGFPQEWKKYLIFEET